MEYSHFDLPGLWFSIYRQVLAINENLKKDRLDKSALREVVTTIFIASTQRGIMRPRAVNKFQAELMALVGSVTDRNHQEQVYKTVKEIVNNGRG